MFSRPNKSDKGSSPLDILTVFCEINDFCYEFEPRFNQMLIGEGKRQRNKPGAMALSEVMTILVLFHLSGFRNLKTFYNGFVGQYLAAEFPHLSSYNRCNLIFISNSG